MNTETVTITQAQLDRSIKVDRETLEVTCAACNQKTSDGSCCDSARKLFEFWKKSK
jgi:hypothetical protein